MNATSTYFPVAEWTTANLKGHSGKPWTIANLRVIQKTAADAEPVATNEN